MNKKKLIKPTDKEEKRARYDNLTKEILNCVDREELKRVFSYEWCELDGGFLGFLDSYEDLRNKIPKDFTIIDFGCYQAIQSYYFKNHKKYIGVDNGLDIEYCLRQNNAEYYCDEIKHFIKEEISKLNLDLNKVFAISSYVPSDECMDLVAVTFPYYRVCYVGYKTRENLPEQRGC